MFRCFDDGSILFYTIVTYPDYENKLLRTFLFLFSDFFHSRKEEKDLADVMLFLRFVHLVFLQLLSAHHLSLCNGLIIITMPVRICTNRKQMFMGPYHHDYPFPSHNFRLVDYWASIFFFIQIR